MKPKSPCRLPGLRRRTHLSLRTSVQVLTLAVTALCIPAGLIAQAPPATVHFSSYFGGTNLEEVAAVRRGPGTQVTLVGYTSSTGLATAGALQPAIAGLTDVFVARFDLGLPQGTQLLWCTYIGGNDLDYAFDAEVDPATGLTYVAGVTRSANFPGTGGVPLTPNGASDGFVVVLDPLGQTLLGSMLLGGSSEDRLCEIELLGNSLVAVAGVTESQNLSATAGRLYPTFRGGPTDAFVAQVNPFGTGTVSWATYLGGAAQDGWPWAMIGTGWTGNFDRMALAIDRITGDLGLATECDPSTAPPPTSSNAPQPNHLGLTDVYLGVLDATGTVLRFGTFYGGASYDRPKSIAAHPQGGFVVGGITFSTNLQTTPGCLQPAPMGSGRDGFLAWIDPSCTTGALRYASYIGCNVGENNVLALACESSGLVTAVGYTGGGNFPTTAGSLQPVPTPGQGAGFVMRLHLGTAGIADLAYSTLVGNSTMQCAVALDEVGDVVVAGRTFSATYPLANPYQSAPGGAVDAVITYLPLLAGGTSRADLGSATPACAARLYASTLGPPQIGNLTFALCATNAPPGAFGIAALGFGPPAVGPLPLLNGWLLVDQPAYGWRMADAAGFATFALPVPARVPPGLVFHCEWLFLTTPVCPGSGTLANSERLLFTTF